MESSGSSTNTLTALLHPNTVAIIGASDNPARIGGRPLHYMREAGFSGSIYPVNPNRRSVQGIAAYARIEDVPETIDSAIVAVPAAAVEDTVEACAATGVKCAIVFSAGFAEMGPEGRHQQERLAAIPGRTGMRILGPNCLGAYTSATGFFATFTSTFEAGRPAPGRIGLVSQSGAYGSHLSLVATMRGLGIRYWVTTGNECDVDVAETIGWLAQQPDVAVIVASAEGVRDGHRLRASLEQARAQKKPVIFQKMGRTKIGAEAARSHTASLAGEDAVFDGIFRQYGVHRARDTEEMLDIAYAATFGTFPASRRVGLMSISGGVGVQMADEAVERGLEVTPMSSAAQAQLKALLPYASPRNPVDITAQAFNKPELVGTNLEVMLNEGIYDAIVAFFTFVAAAKTMVAPISESLRAARSHHPRCLLVLSIVGPTEIIRTYEEAGCPVFEDPARAVRAVDALSRFSDAFARAPETTVRPASHPVIPPPPIAEHTAKRILSEAGLPMVEERLCSTPRDAGVAAGNLGFPVVTKVTSPDIPHKTEVGGVEIGLESVAAVEKAAITVLNRAQQAHPDARLDGVLVSRQVIGGIETIFWIQHDPTFGPIVMFGLGGIFVETLQDVALRAAPFDQDEAHRMIRELQGFPVLAGSRGRPAGDLEAVATALVALSHFAAANADNIASAELNPVVVLPKGQGVVALDALLIPTTTS